MIVIAPIVAVARIVIASTVPAIFVTAVIRSIIVARDNFPFRSRRLPGPRSAVRYGYIRIAEALQAVVATAESQTEEDQGGRTKWKPLGNPDVCHRTTPY